MKRRLQQRIMRYILNKGWINLAVKLANTTRDWNTAWCIEVKPGQIPQPRR